MSRDSAMMPQPRYILRIGGGSERRIHGERERERVREKESRRVRECEIMSR